MVYRVQGSGFEGFRILRDKGLGFAHIRLGVARDPGPEHLLPNVSDLGGLAPLGVLGFRV